ncbi:unnamed protein product [Rotaria socialis]|uniref:Carrier domain-containing protein n=1 Tax=Rotaria socialis TaxID=392032 RepID=A0A820X4P8_9BILA|nr:unnamed protein product [Rotaria socialis]CAF4525743.1 unnamed protein product [Rotaria socialis]
MSSSNISFLEGLKTHLPDEYRTVYNLFIQTFMIGDHGQRVCAIFDECTLTAEKLVQGAHRIAAALSSYEIVAICMRPCIELIITLCGVILRGIPYIPLEPSLPPERIDYIINDSQVSVIITNDCLPDLRKTNATTLSYSQLIGAAINSDNCRMVEVTSEDIFCLMYTSGSTGQPKGVEIPHRALVNRLYWQWSRFPFQEKDICCLKTSISFVDSIAEIFLPLFRRIPIIILTKSLLLDVDQFILVLSIRRISRIVLVPSFLALFLDHLQHSEASLFDLNMIVCSGEILPINLIESFLALKNHFSPICRLLNLYGSTEIMADATCEIFDSIHGLYDRLSYEGHVSIGSPIDNIRVEIVEMDERGIGEIVVRGEGVANGYHNEQMASKQNLTNKFIPTDNGQFAFRTGDLGKMWNDRIIFYGRKDSQVKLAGNRVDLCEIELVLQRHCHCCHPVAVFLEEKSEIVVFLQETEQPINCDRNFLANYLPNYAIPTRFITITEYPLLVSGKIDRRQLIHSLNAIEKREQEQEEDLSEEDRTFFCALKEIGIPRGSIDQNFFDAGGSSLNALLLVAKLHRTGFHNLTVERLISAKTLRDILLHRTENERSRGLFFESNNEYHVLPLEQVSKDEALRIITKSFIEKGEIDVLVHRQCRELKDECQNEWYTLLDRRWPHYIKNGLSFGVVMSDGQLVGISLSNNIEDEAHTDLATIPRLAPLFHMIEKGENKILEQFRSSNSNIQKIMHSFLTAVNPDVESNRRVSIMHFLERHVLEIGSTNEFQAILTANAGSVTQQIAEYVLNYDYHLVLRANEYCDSSGTRVFSHALEQHTIDISIKLLI